MQEITYNHWHTDIIDTPQRTQQIEHRIWRSKLQTDNKDVVTYLLNSRIDVHFVDGLWGSINDRTRGLISNPCKWGLSATYSGTFNIYY